MKHLLVILALISSTCYADVFESKKTIVCDDFPTLIAKLEEFKEKVTWVGSPDSPGDVGSTITLMENPSTGSWTLIQYNSKWGCLLAAGTNKKT